MKPLKFSSLILLGGILSIYLGLLAVSSLSPNVNDSDLQVSAKSVAPEDNAFEQLQTAISQLWWPADKDSALRQLVTATNWDAALAAEVLTRNQAAFAAIDAALTASGFQVPDFRQGDELPYLSKWKRLGELAVIRANASARVGQSRQALEQAMLVVRLGERMEASEGAAIHYLVGLSVKAQGLAAIRRAAGAAGTSPQQLLEVAAQLRPLADDGAAVSNALKVDYRLMLQIAADFREGKLGGEGQMPRALWKLLPAFNHGRTKALLADGTRELLAAVPVSYREADLTDFEAGRPGVLRLIFSGNAVGQTLFYLTMPALNGVITAKCRSRSQVEATRTILALRVWELKHGRLPDDLAALTPELLEAVPLDHFVGRPLHYLPERKLLYSVGENLQDDHGEAKDAQDRRLDYPYPIDF